jgi:uncharacterized membrane protein YfcA
MPTAHVIEVMAMGGLAGLLGALLGLGGGVFLVPFLVAVLGLPFALSRGISLMTVIATSSAVAAGTGGRALINLRLAMLLQVATAAGGLSGGMTSDFVPERVLTALFGAVTLVVAVVMLVRLDRRNVILDAGIEPGRFGGRFYEHESGQEVVYRIRRLPLALVVSFAGGNISSLLGIGGGILLVPALNAFCGVPMRAAAATSSFMIGITAVSAVPIYYMHGEVVPHLAAAAVLGVLAGSRMGMRFAVRTRAKRLKLLMIGVLVAVTLLMAWRLR